MRNLPVNLTVAAIVALVAFPASAELGSDNPTDAAFLTERAAEAGSDTSTSPPTCPSGMANAFNSGSFDIGSPPSGTAFTPAGRLRREKFGVVGPFMLGNGLTEKGLDSPVFPGTTLSEK